MPRKPRMYMPDVPCHVIQRGNNRSTCFFTDGDYRFYLSCLKDAADRYQVGVHAYVLMTNHVHLLMTPECRLGISKVMQSVGRRYVQYINRTYRRSGTLWEDRHKANLVHAEEYLLTCYKYIELNPVRAGMVVDPYDYRWSSYRYNAFGESDPLVRYHPVYKQLSQDKLKRLYLYRGLFTADLCREDLYTIRNALNFSKPLGNDRFKSEIEAVLRSSSGQGKKEHPDQA